MTRSLENRFTQLVAMMLPCTVLMSLVPGLGGIGPSTSAAVVALMTVGTAIIVQTWRNGQPVGSMGQLIHETDMMPLRVPALTTQNSLQQPAGMHGRGAMRDLPRRDRTARC